MVAIAGILSTTAFADCSSDNKEAIGARTDVGSLDLAVKLSPGVDVHLVAYEILGNGIAPIVGDVDVSDPRCNDFVHH